MAQTEIPVHRGHIVGVLLANAILWVAVIFIAGKALLAGPAAIALITIGSLFKPRPKTA